MASNQIKIDQKLNSLALYRVPLAAQTYVINTPPTSGTKLAATIHAIHSIHCAYRYHLVVEGPRGDVRTMESYEVSGWAASQSLLLHICEPAWGP